MGSDQRLLSISTHHLQDPFLHLSPHPSCGYGLYLPSRGWGSLPTSFLSDLVEPSFSRSKSDLTSSMRLSPTTPPSTALPWQSMAGDSPLYLRMPPDYSESRLLEDWVRGHASGLSMVSLCAGSFDIAKCSIPVVLITGRSLVLELTSPSSLG